MIRLTRSSTFFLIIAAFAVVLGLVYLIWFHRTDLAYDNSPENVIIYADLRSYPVAPPPGQECLGKFFPRLRIWGDGLVFLDISSADTKPPWQWSGHLTSERIRSMLKSLEGQGFFGGWTPEGPNTAATSLRIGAHLEHRSVEYESGDLEPKLYTQLTDQIMPDLQPLTQEDTKDARIQSVLAELAPCRQ